MASPCNKPALVYKAVDLRPDGTMHSIIALPPLTVKYAVGQVCYPTVPGCPLFCWRNCTAAASWAKIVEASCLGHAVVLKCEAEISIVKHIETYIPCNSTSAQDFWARQYSNAAAGLVLNGKRTPQLVLAEWVKPLEIVATFD